MGWTFLVMAGILETGFAVFLKLSNGFRHIGYTAAFAGCAMASFALLNLSIRTLPIGTAYAVWTGIGATGAAIVGMIWFGDSTSGFRIASLAVIVSGIVGLNLSGRGSL